MCHKDFGGRDMLLTMEQQRGFLNMENTQASHFSMAHFSVSFMYLKTDKRPQKFFLLLTS